MESNSNSPLDLLLCLIIFVEDTMSVDNFNLDPLSPFQKELPEDLGVEIFVRLSVESLLRVKVVCKLWYAIVENPSFTKHHLEYQKMTSKDQGRFLFRRYLEETRNPNYFLFDEESLASGTTSSFYTSLLDPCLHQCYQVSIHGPINGLYCVYNGRDRLVIWNPSTSEAGFLPLPLECLPGGMSIYFGNIGFGRDPLSEEDYKIVLFCQYGEKDSWFCCMFYSATTNTWRLVKDHDDLRSCDPCRFTSNNTYLNGIYYWLWESDVFGSEKEVVAFDLGNKETSWTIPTPRVYLEEEKTYNGKIALHGDHIAMFKVDKKRHDLYIWILEDDYSWIKKFSVEGIPGLVTSLGFWRKDDELLLVIDDELSIYDYNFLYHENSQTVVYNTTTRQVTWNVGPRGRYVYFETAVYYESLVSVVGGMTRYKGNHASVVDAISQFLYPDEA